MNIVKLQQRGLLTLPKKMRDALGLREGQALRIMEDSGRIILEPQRPEIDQELAAAIKQGIADIKAGNYIEFSSLDEFDKKIERY